MGGREGNALFDSLQEAWNVSTNGYLLIRDDDAVAFGNEETQALFQSCTTGAEVLARLSVPSGRAFAGLAGWHGAGTIALNSGEIARVELEYIPVSKGRWIVLRSLGSSFREGQRDGDFVEAVLDSAEAIITVIARDGTIVRFNRAAEILSGYREREVIGKYFWDLFIVEEDLQPIRDAFQSMVAGRGPTHRENRWRMRDGALRDIAWSNTVLRNADGEVGYVVSCGIDVTVTRQAQVALEALSEKALNQMQGERNKLSRFLHDTVSQDLVALSFSLSNLQRNENTPGALEAIEQSLHLLDRCCRDIRQLSYILSPPIFSEVGLGPALQWYGMELERAAGMQVEVDIDSFEVAPAPEVQSILFATLQACVARSIRNDDKTKKRVALKQKGDILSLRYDSQLQIGIASVEPAELLEEFSVIRERLRFFKGTLQVESNSESISVVACLPLPAAR